jgi:hypothetical protein
VSRAPTYEQKMESLRRRLEKHTVKAGPNECWSWDGYHNRDGSAMTPPASPAIPRGPHDVFAVLDRRVRHRVRGRVVGDGMDDGLTITEADKVYVACILDNFGNLNIRRLKNGTRQPVVFMHGNRPVIMRWLAEITNTKAVPIQRQYSRHVCSEHCPDQHEQVDSVSMRWQVTGMKATIVLFNVVEYMRERHQEARAAMMVGLAAPYKEAYVEWMESAGWTIPDLDPSQDADRKRVMSG